MPDLSVTVVTPSYNQAAYLEEAIRSVLAQDYRPLEYIVVDGASTDGSLEVIQKYAHQLSLWISEPDAGQAEAINKGFARANGEVLAWLNSDDLYLPGAVRRAVNILADHPEVGFVFGDALSIDPQGKPLKHLQGHAWKLLDLMRFRILTQPAVFIRREALEKVGFLDASYHFMLDHHLWLRLAMHHPFQYAGMCQQDGQRASSRRAGLSPSTLWAAARHHPTAKNVAHAAGFYQETLRLLEWMRQHPALKELFFQNRRKILGGAYRLGGRYLLDGGLPKAALRSYLLAFKYDPSYALKHSHRVLYALFKSLGLNFFLDPWINTQRRRNQQKLRQTLVALMSSSQGASSAPPSCSWEGWPGLKLQKE